MMGGQLPTFCDGFEENNDKDLMGEENNYFSKNDKGSCSPPQNSRENN